jgi:hypothetical protein
VDVPKPRREGRRLFEIAMWIVGGFAFLGGVASIVSGDVVFGVIVVAAVIGSAALRTWASMRPPKPLSDVSTPTLYAAAVWWGALGLGGFAAVLFGNLLGGTYFAFAVVVASIVAMATGFKALRLARTEPRKRGR